MAAKEGKNNGMYMVGYMPIDENEFTKNYCENKNWLTFEEMEVGQIILVNGQKIKVKSIKVNN